MAHYRKKPVVIQAILWTGNNLAEAKELAGDRDVEPAGEKCLEVYTLEGVMLARPGDWIIKGVKGEIYPCKPDIFHATYERVDP